MKNTLIIAALAVQVLVLITLGASLTKKGVKWNNFNEPGKLQAVSTCVGNETTLTINSALEHFFAAEVHANKNSQFTIKEIANNTKICIVEISVISETDASRQKQTYELWAVLNKAEPKVFIQHSSDVQGFDYLSR